MNLTQAKYALQFKTGNWTLDNFRLLADLCENQIKCDPIDLIKVLCIESSMDPSSVAYDPKTGAPVAVGLNQITRYSAAQMGLISRDRTKNYKPWMEILPQIQYAPIGTQLYLVARHFDSVPWASTGKRFDGLRLYQSNFLPYSLPAKTKIDDVLTAKGDGSGNYEGNPELDIVDPKGAITNADLVAALAGVPYAKRTSRPYAAAVVMLKAATGAS